MAENIELYSYPARKVQEEEIQIYQEIKQDGRTPETVETTFSPKLHSEPISKYEFFTTREPKPTPKKTEKKKKSKKKEKSPNLMDIVNSELASMTVPISENHIEVVESHSNNFRDYFNCFSRDFRTTERRRSYFDLKHRFQNSQTIHLRPVFPDVLELSAIETQDLFPVVYVEPDVFDDVVAEYNTFDDDYLAKFLDVDLKNIKFKHHHKYSLEHLLSVKLIEQFNEYKNLHTTLQELSKDIKVGRETKNNLKRELLRVSPNKNELRFDATMRKYVGQLLNLKEKYIEVFKKHKSAIHKTLSLWSDIEMIREKFKCKDTPYDLYIKKYNLSEDELEKEWHEMYEEEFNDMLDKLEYDYVTKYIEYKDAKNDQSLQSESNKKVNKPRMNVNEDELKSEIESLVNSFILREKIDLSVVKVEEKITEINRMKNTYHFEIHVDKIFVCESEDYKSDDESLGANFIESFSIEILPKNEYLTFVLFENNEEMASVQLNLYKVRNINVNDDFAVVEFQYCNDKVPTPKSVGTGSSIKEIAAANKVRLKSSNIFKGDLKTTCEVLIKIGWKPTFNQMEAVKSSMEISKTIKRLRHGIDKPNIDVMTDIIGKIYGRDIKNDEEMLNTIHRLCKLEVKADKFLLDESSPENVRLKLLHIRNNGGFTHVKNKIVPINGSQITTEQLNCLQKTKEKDIDIDYLKSKEADMDRIELQRFIAAKYMQKLNQNVMKSLNEYLMVKTQKDVVREYQNFSWRFVD